MNELKIFHVVLGVVVAVAALGASAQAVDPERARKAVAELQKRFAAADANGDGRLTKEEAKDKMPMVYKNFDAIDTAAAGSVSMADIAAYARSHRGARNAPQ